MSGIIRGQIWERVKDKCQIRVVDFDPTWDDVTYEKVDGDTRRSSIFAYNLRAMYRLVQGPDA